MNFRIGFGYDVHRLEAGLPLWLGGVEILHEKGAVGHSDADVLLHAICDALLGAAALGDIGEHFPDTDPSYKGIASTILLQRTIELVREKGYEINNIDSTICLQIPKIKPFILNIRQQIASQLGLDKDVVSVKATTEEKLGFTGREEGVSAYAVVMLQRPRLD
ncbi:MAG: 2-C-methyl-D-erythritol 2,4-cyclodiphosphate synthase [Bacteroidales bacterium]|nr:2-C-methyl-D-erythritol 2,4-cyclodiphosphate synthase [Bacteroidales bacterium]